MTVRQEDCCLRALSRAFSVGDEPPPSDFPAKMPEPQAPPRIAPAAADTLTALSARHRAAGASRPAEAPVNGAGTVGFGRCLECRVLFGSTAGRHTGVPPAKRWTGALRAILLHVETALHHPAPDNGPLAIQFTRPVHPFPTPIPLRSPRISNPNQPIAL